MYLTGMTSKKMYITFSLPTIVITALNIKKLNLYISYKYINI
jgi:hypothetical protein